MSHVVCRVHDMSIQLKNREGKTNKERVWGGGVKGRKGGVIVCPLSPKSIFRGAKITPQVSGLLDHPQKPLLSGSTTSKINLNGSRTTPSEGVARISPLDEGVD